MSGVPVMSRELITHPDFAQPRPLQPHWRSAAAARSCRPTWCSRSTSRSPPRGRSTGYGMTETCGIITALSGDFFVDKPASAGPAMPSYEVKCVDDDGDEVPPGELGELWVRGAQVIKGYINRPEATAETITDGWLHTGDIARLDDDGFIYIVDRKKEMVLRGGENIYCAEVEAAVYRHEAVAECSASSASPTSGWARRSALAVRLRPGSSAHRRGPARPPRRAHRPPQDARATSGSCQSPCRATPPASSSAASCANGCRSRRRCRRDHVTYRLPSRETVSARLTDQGSRDVRAVANTASAVRSPPLISAPREGRRERMRGSPNPPSPRAVPQR